MHGGLLALDDGRLAEARESYERAIEQLIKPISAEDASDQDLAYFLKLAADAAVRLEDWENAARVFEKKLELDRDDPQRWYELAIAHLGRSETDPEAIKDYRRVCADMLEHFGGTVADTVAERIVYTCVPAADAVADIAQLESLAKRSVRLWEGNIRLQGAVAYRCGAFESTVYYLDQVAEDQRRAWDWFFLAMAHHQLEHVPQARRYLREGVRWLNEHTDTGWTERIESRSLRDQAEPLIETNE